MNPEDRRRKQRRCAHCGESFVVDPRLGDRHQYCKATECVRASHLASQRKWRKSPKGADYFRGWQNVERVRAWRQAHPGYNRKSHPFSSEVSASLLAEIRRIVLQDSIDSRAALLVGLIAHVSNLALQDAIAFELRRIILRGHEILKQRPAQRSKRRNCS